MRSKFDEQLALLSRELTQMGALCEEVIALAAKSITTGDVAIAEKVAPLDGEIDRMEHSIEALCLKLLLQQQPVARDLRQISAALKMITDMERIGDQASDIAEIVRFLGGRSTADYFLKVKSSLIRMIADKPEDGEYALDLLMIAKYFERIGDHAVNIAEWVVFSVTGVHKNEEG